MKVFKRVGMGLDEIQDMLGEAILLSRIGHPNIVRVFDANVIQARGGTCGYFTMENVPGRGLEKFWHSHGAKFVPVQTSVELLKQVCRGIAQAHREKPPIIHRDIKPQNILVGYEAEGFAGGRVSDFGLAKKVNPLTLLATAAGTLAFKAAEKRFADRKGDNLAQLTFGPSAPHSTCSSRIVCRSTCPPTPLGLPRISSISPRRHHPPSIPMSAKTEDNIVIMALQRRPEDRFPTAKELLNALENCTSTTHTTTLKSKTLSSEPSKTVLGLPSPADDAIAQDLAEKAFKARQGGRLAAGRRPHGRGFQ